MGSSHGSLCLFSLLCSLALTPPAGSLLRLCPATSQDRPSSQSPSHLEKEAGRGGVHKWRLKLPKKGLVGQGMEDEESGPLLQYSNSRPQRRGPYTFPGQEFQQTWQRPLGYLLQPLWGEDIVLQGGIFIRLLGETGECHGKSSPWLNAHHLCLLS